MRRLGRKGWSDAVAVPGHESLHRAGGVWQDFHLAFLPALRGRLVAQVRPKYIVLLDEHIYVQEPPPTPRRLVGRADVWVSRPPSRKDRGAGGVGILETPVEVRIPEQDVRRVPFLEVRDRRERDLITTIELLSPANKRGGADREPYVAKRETLLKSGAHFVEIDLPRGGRPMALEGRPRAQYSVLVSRAGNAPGPDSGRSDCGNASPSSRSR